MVPAPKAVFSLAPNRRTEVGSRDKWTEEHGADPSVVQAANSEVQAVREHERTEGDRATVAGRYLGDCCRRPQGHPSERQRWTKEQHDGAQLLEPPPSYAAGPGGCGGVRHLSRDGERERDFESLPVVRKRGSGEVRQLVKCKACGIEAHRDVAGALNIGAVHSGGHANWVMAHPLDVQV